jgi:NIPSNAP
MIFDLRIYTFKPGMQTAWLAMYEKHAYPIQLRYLGKPVVFTTTEVGPLNQVVHLWAYADQAERERKRNAMQQDPEWQTYIKMNTEAGYMEHMENRILRSTSFSPL